MSTTTLSDCSLDGEGYINPQYVKWLSCDHCYYCFVVMTQNEDGDDFDETPNYCPYCGAEVIGIE